MKSSQKINKHYTTAVENTTYEYRSPTRSTNGRSSPNNFRHSPPTLTLSPKRSPRSPQQRIAITMLTSKNSNILSILGILILTSLFMNMYFWSDTYRGVVSVDRQKIDGAWEPLPVKVADRRFGKRMRLFQDKKNGISQSYSSKEGSQNEYQQRKDDIKQLKQMKRQEIKLRKQSTNTSKQGVINWIRKEDIQQIEKIDGVQHQLRTFRFHPSRRRESHLPQLELSLPTSTTSIRHEQVVILDGISGIISKLDEDNLEDWLVHTSNGEDNDLDHESEDQEELAMRSSTAVWENDEQCVPMADWQTTLHPTCNSLHEMDIASLLYDMTFGLVSNKGYWRSAWKIDESVILKSLKYTHEPNMEVFELSKVDAISLDVLTKSQFVINIHSFCGSSSIQEFAGGDLKGLLPKLDPLDKLRYATYMAEGLADIHSVASVDEDNTHSMASLIHNDINMDNVLLGYRNGKTMPIFNDFNIAIFPKKNVHTGEPCTFKGRFANPQWMSPEQLSVSDENHLTIGSLNEKIDVYALGNILFKVVNGNSPWKYDYQKDPKVLPKITEELKEKIVRAKLRGAKPKVPPEIRNTTDSSIKAVLNAMNRCYRNDPVLRPSARDTYNYLKTELDAIERSMIRSGGGKSKQIV